MNRSLRLFLQDILQAGRHIQEFVEDIDFDDFQKDAKTSSAVIRQFEIIGEAARHVPESVREKYPDVSWRQMAGMRDRLVHGYFGVDYQLVWDTIKTHIPELIAEITRILDQMEE